jgi:guanylate kinase
LDTQDLNTQDLNTQDLNTQDLDTQDLDTSDLDMQDLDTKNMDTQAVLARRGLLLVISSPSGAGKTSLTALLRNHDPALATSVSVTTRARRPSEVDGVHYHFITEDRFHALAQRGELLEWAQVHGNFYGTPRDPVETALAAGRDMLFDIDWQGAEQMRQRLPDDMVGVFVLPPSAQELRARLKRRAEDADEVIARRLSNARGEITHWRDYDYVLVNDDIERAFGQLRAILEAERARRVRQVHLEAFTDGLIADLGGMVGAR